MRVWFEVGILELPRRNAAALIYVRSKVNCGKEWSCLLLKDKRGLTKALKVKCAAEEELKQRWKLAPVAGGRGDLT